MDRQPKASIIIPVYNVEKQLPKCLDSALNQTYENYEIICVNDQSPDNSAAILADYQKRYPDRITCIDNEENIGQGRSRMKALTASGGDYIFFLDSDDYIDSDYLETYISQLQEDDYDMVIAGFKRIMPDKIQNHDVVESQFTRVCYTVACCKMYKKDFIVKNGIDFTDKRIGEDIHFMLSLYLAGAKTKIIHYFGYNYLLNPKSTTGTLNYNKHFERVVADMFSSLIEKYPLSSLTKEQVYYLQYAYVSSMADALFHYGRGCKPKMMKEMHAFVVRDMFDKFPDIKENPFFKIRGINGPSMANKLGVAVFMTCLKLHLDGFLCFVASLI